LEEVKEEFELIKKYEGDEIEEIVLLVVECVGDVIMRL
jgi:hypothetical protein